MAAGAAESQSDSKIFSVRIVSIDHYMAPPIPGVDICYSSFQGGKVNEVPVIRVYGSTPAGQKTCLHVHGAFPYLYVPCSDIPINPNQDGDAYTNSVSLAFEKALKLEGNAGSKRQHVHGCSLVRARKFYGYHPSEELFMKVYLYYPHDVSRAANHLLGGAVLDKILQPHEAHIPFILQFLIDYNLYGMGHLHLSKMKFRCPIPRAFVQRQFNCNDRHGQQMYKTTCVSADVQADSSSSESLDFPLWISSTIPSDWRLETSSEYDTPSDQVIHNIQRQSICELEGDAIVDDILNQQFKMYMSLSQAHSDVKMVQSLIPIWEEEYERGDMCEAAMPPDPGKPLPKDILKIFSHGLEFERKLKELYSKSEDKPLPTGCKLNSISSVASLTVEKKLVELGDVISNISSPEPLKGSPETQRHIISYADDEEIRSSKMIGTQNPKVSDTEALGLLRWLATSQSAEDMNSDDELVRETILSPLLPATSIDKVLEKANIDYESESQKECQDILDSVGDIIDCESSQGKPSSLEFCHFPQTSSQKKISQVGDNHSSPNLAENTYNIETKAECKRHSLHQVQQCTATSSINKNKRKKHWWGSLPFNVAQDLNDSETVKSSSADLCVVDCKNYGCPALSANEDRKCSDALIKSPDTDFGEAHPFVGCSIRDLMRLKRSCLVAPRDSCNAGVEKDHSGELDADTVLFPEGFDLHTPPATEHDKNPLGFLEFGPSITSQKEKVLGSFPFVFNSGCPSQAKNCGNKSTHAGSTPEKELQEIPSEGPMGMEISAKTVLLQNEKCSAKPKGDSGLYGLCSSPSKAFNGEGKSANTIGMTFWKKPPIADWNDVVSKSVSFPTALYSYSSLVNGDNTGGTSGCDSDELLPFFESECPEKDGFKNISMSNCNFSVQTEDFVGVPTHYLNDGSLLYLLTQAFSPPSSDSVSAWLLSNNEGTYGISSRISSPLGSDKVSTEPVSALLPMHQQKIKGDQNERNIAKPNACPDCLVDISQISGPDGRARPTPLSQIGFRDPASIGAGQQLTILSIEVHAESRADLRPDPRFDAINVVAIALQNDNDPATLVYVLLRSDTDACQRSFDGISSHKLLVCFEEKQLFSHFIRIVGSYDPDILMGWDIQGGSLGFLGERAAHLGIGLLNSISRTPLKSNTDNRETESFDMEDLNTVLHESLLADSVMIGDAVIEDEWGRTHASGVHVGGRVVLNIWRLMRGEIKLNMYTAEAVSEAVLKRKIPSIPFKMLTKWFVSGPGRARYRCIEYVMQRAKLNLEIMNQLDMINRTSELARVYGIDFFSVLSRGSQYRVESMLLRLAHSQNYIAISPGNQQVASQPAMECLPLVMEPESGFYADPVVVLDFQSLYPSMIIAYNLCFCTCLGNVAPSKTNTLGVSSFSPDPHIFQDLKDKMLVSPNGVMYVPSQVRKGILPRLLEEILSTRIMVKQAMKKLTPSQHVLRRIFNARQLALKLIANVTYGYTAAGFSGRMPCAELADSIVQCGRSTLEKAISLVNANEKWKARVIYGDTDSLFVLLKGGNVKESFQIGHEIASAVTAMNPNPVTLKLEKVYHPCFLLTKKRYVGYSYESADQIEPMFDAKGIETVRRDTCGVVAKMMEQSLRLFFEHQDMLEVKGYLLRQWSRILSGRVSLQDFVFAKEVRLGTYSARASSCLPPAAIVATKAMKVDPRTEPRYAERVPYVVIHGEPGARLVDMVVDPLDLLAVDSPYRLNDLYYINKQIIPALLRVFGLLGADLKQWFGEMPRPTKEGFAKRPLYSPNRQRTRIDFYYLSKHCVLCGELVNASTLMCNKCSQKETTTATALVGRTSKLEKDIHHLTAICRHCGGGDWLVESGVKCTSLACSVFYERRKVQKELKGLSAVVADKGLYPKCVAEWF